jgi:CheY-like chemotaxis protein
MTQKILVVDDSKVVVAMLKDTLEENRYQVCTAYDGKDGIEKAKNENPDLIILDVHMPALTGYEFVRALRAHRLIEGKKAVPVIMLTASEEMEDIFKIEGVQGYFVKPVEMNVLIQKIKECLGSND